jgi:hypothetical protein
LGRLSPTAIPNAIEYSTMATISQASLNRSQSETKISTAPVKGITTARGMMIRSNRSFTVPMVKGTTGPPARRARMVQTGKV